MFSRYVLRTTDPASARRFYLDALELALPEGASENCDLECWPLHERARALGAPAHWLGHLVVDDVANTVERVVRAGGERLGPPVEAGGVAWATLRDPFGAVLAATDRASCRTDNLVAWHQLHVRDAAGAQGLYSELFGLPHTHTIEIPGLDGGHRVFAFSPDDDDRGSIANTARWPGVHPHWLFYFLVPNVENAAARVRALGGTAMEPVAFPNGSRLSACEDPQGAAFGLMEIRNKQVV